MAQDVGCPEEGGGVGWMGVEGAPRKDAVPPASLRGSDFRFLV